MAKQHYSRRDVLRGLGGLALAPAVRANPFSFLVSCPTSWIPAVANRPRDVVGLEAYAQKSVAAGETIDFRISSPFAGEHKLSIIRLGWDTEQRTKDWILSTVALPAPGRQTVHPGSYVHVEKALESSADFPAFTVECWVRPFRGPGHYLRQGLVTQYTEYAPCGFALAIDDQGRLTAYFGDGGPGRAEWLRTSPSPLAEKVWQHVAATFDAGVVTLFVNGAPVDQATLPGLAAFRPGEAPLRIGAFGDAAGTGFFLDGDLAMPAMYGRALEPSEIAGRAQKLVAPRAPRDASLLGCWRFAEERGPTVADASACGRTGTIVHHGTWMIGGPSYDANDVPGNYAPDADPLRGHGLRLSSSDLHDCGWSITQSMTIPVDSPPGLYVGRIECQGCARYDVTFLVRRAPTQPAAPIVVLAATNTWLAYNKPLDLFGLYDEHEASQPTYYQGFEMPWSNPAPYGRFKSDADPYVTYSTSPGYSHLVRAERFLHVWLEQNGYDYDLIGDRDLHTRPDALAPYKVLFVAGHSEYWTREAQAKVKDWVTAGGKLVVVSGNTMFWRVSMDDSVLECRKPCGAPGGFANAKLGEIFHEHDHARGGPMRTAGCPAWEVTGLETAGFDGTHVPYEVTNWDHVFFQTPEAIAVTPPPGGPLVKIGGPTAVGHEWDATLAEIPGHGLSGPAVTVLAQGRGDGTEIKLDYGFGQVPSSGVVISEMIEWSSGAGRVFAAGSIASGNALHEKKMAALFRNVLHHFGLVFRVQVSAIGTNGNLVDVEYDGESWGSPVEDATGGFGPHAPSCVPWGPDTLASLSVTSAGALLFRHGNGEAWSPWFDLSDGIVFRGRPAAVAWGRDRLMILARDAGGRILCKTRYGGPWEESAWSGWTDLGGPFASDPATVVWEGNKVSAAVLDGAGRVRYREFVDGVWGTTWRSVGGNFAHTPTLVAWGGNRLSLFAVDASGRLWMRFRRGRTWSPAQSAWIDLGTPASGLASRVQVGITGHDQATGTDTFSVFGICADGRLALKWWTGTGFGPSTTGWWDLGGSLAGEPAVAAYRGSRISVLAAGTDAQLRRLDWDGTAWSAWNGMGVAIVGSPAAFPRLASTGG